MYFITRRVETSSNIHPVFCEFPGFTSAVIRKREREKEREIKREREREIGRKG